MVIDFSPFKLVWKEDLNSLQVVDEVVSQLGTSEQKVNQLLKTGGKRLLINLLIRSTFSRRTLLLN